MELLMANELTGEVIGVRSDVNPAQGLKALRGVIRKWMDEGLNIHQFNVLKWSDYQLWQYLREYAWQHMISKCDVCNTPRRNSDLEWLDDSEGVCLMAICKHDSCPSDDVYEF